MTIQVEKKADVLEDGKFVQEFKVGSRTISIISFKVGDENVRLYRYDNLECNDEMFRPVMHYTEKDGVKLDIRTVAMRQFPVEDAYQVYNEIAQVQALIQEVQKYLKENGITQLDL